jgi:hypothetical protein
MRVRRRNALLNDAIEALDEVFLRAKSDPLLAFSRLSNLELEFVREEIENCVTSRAYYIENYHIIKSERGETMGMYPIWDLQWLIEEAIQKEREATGQCKVIVLKPRQSGGTEFSTATMSWCTFFTPHAYTLTVAQDPDVAMLVQNKITFAWHSLPWWLRPEIKYHNHGEYLEFQRGNSTVRQRDPGMGSIFVTTHAQRMSGVAIGRTVRFFHGTEVSRWASGSIYTADIKPSMNAPDTLAIMESASFDDKGFFRRLWDSAVESEDSEWVPVFLPAYRAKKFAWPRYPLKMGKPLSPPLTQEEANLRERAKLEENFKIPDEFFNWRRRKIRESIEETGYPYDAYSSFPVTPKEAFQSSGTGAFPRHKLDEQEQKFVRKPKWHGVILFQGINQAPQPICEEVQPGQLLLKREHANQLWIWERPDPSETYYIGVDTATGQAADFSAAPIWRAGKGTAPDVQVAEWHGKISPTDFAKTLYALGTWYNKAEISVEYLGSGITTGDYLFGTLEYMNVYRPRNKDRIGKQLAAYVHWQTNYKSKTLIIVRMVEALLEGSIIIRSQSLLDEMRKFSISSVSPTGQISYAGLDEHDDLVMSAMIGLYCLRETLLDLKSPNYSTDGAKFSPSHGARPGGGGISYGVYDQYTRQRAQTRDLIKAQELVAANPGWVIRPIPITRANTAYSVIHHGTGAENQLWRQGVDQKEITPGFVSAYRMRFDGDGKLVSVPVAQAGDSDADELNDAMAGMDWESDLV